MGVTYLLDTHVLLWLLSDPARVPEKVRARLGDPAAGLLVSAVTPLEIATKICLGRLTASGLVEALPQHLRRIGAEEASITHADAALAGSMSWPHSDPFDRLLVAQATLRGSTLVTVDAAMSDLNVPSVLSW